MKTIFWNVDTQYDFIEPNGALYVSGAETIKPSLEKLTRYARQKRIKVLGSVDAHTEKDPELQANGGPFPFHCLAGTPGQKHIPETTPQNPLYVQNRSYSNAELEEILAHKGEIIFEKQHYDVFTNPNTAEVLRRFGIKTAIVYGVATDYCDKAAALGLHKLGIEVYLVEDAIRPVTEEGGKQALRELYFMGVKPVTTAQVLEGIL